MMSTSTRMNGQTRGVPPSIPPKATSSDKQSAPSLCQVIALVMCYRRLGFVFLTMPMIVSLGPILVNVLLGILNSVTRGFGILCLVLVGCSVLAWTHVLKAMAPPGKLDEAYQKSQVVLPLAMFLVYGAGLRIISGVLGPNFSQWTPTLAWNVGVRPAIGLLFINAAILFRFVGPGSIIRCSTVPLASNEFINSFKDITIPEPSAWRIRTWGRRQQCPTISSFCANMIATCIAGYLVSEYIFLPYHEVSGKMKQFLDFTCLMTMTIHLWVPNFDGIRHELNPRHYKSNQAAKGKTFPRLISSHAFKEILKRVVSITACISVVGIGCIGTRYKSIFLIESPEWSLILHCIATSACLGLYVAAVEEFGKATLFVGSRLQRFVREVTSGSKGGGSFLTLEEEESFVVDVALYSLLHGDSCCIQQIGESAASKNPSYLQLESYESERSKRAGHSMASVLVGTNKRRPVEVALEEDILRISFLESLGGSAPVSVSGKTKGRQQGSEVVVWKETGAYPMGQRHREAIEYWVKPTMAQVGLIARGGNLANNEPKVILLTRALTAYVSGLGMALTECSEPWPHAATWLLRPGALVAAEYSVVGLSRLYQVYFEHINKSAADWRRGQLSTLMPASLNGLFVLHCGILDHASYLKKSRGRVPQGPKSARNKVVIEMSENFAKDHPDLQQVLHAIQEAAKKIVRQLGNTYNTMATKNAIDSFCQQWIDRMMAPSREG